MEFRNALSAPETATGGVLHSGRWLVEVRVVPVGAPPDDPGVWVPAFMDAWRERGVVPCQVHVPWGPLSVVFPAWFARADVRPRTTEEPPP